MMNSAPTVLNPHLSSGVKSEEDEAVSDAVRACQFGDEDALHELMEPSCGKVLVDANTRDKEDVPLLHWAAINDRREIVSYLLKQGADARAYGGILQETALMWAARSGYMAIINDLLQAGADCNHRNTYGQSALHLAAQRGHVNTVLLVLSAGVPVNVTDSKGYTPLMYATKLCITDTDLTRVLLSYGLSSGVELRDMEEGNTPLHWAIVGNVKSPYALAPLLKAGASLDAKNKAGHTPAELATSMGNHSLARYLKTCRRLPMKARDVPLLRGLLLPLLQLLWCFGMVGFFGCWGCAAGAAGIGATTQVTYRIAQFDANWLPLGFALWSLVLIMGSEAAFMWLEQDLIRSAGTLVSGLMTLWFLYKSLVTDPGSLPRDESTRQSSIKRLAAEGRLNSQNLCTTCIVEKAPRSKHCDTCGKCVLRFDHHCPFVGNCVGQNNHHYFIGFLSFAVLGISTFLWNLYSYRRSDCDHWAMWVCVFRRSKFLGCVSILASYHDLWISILLLTHLRLVLINATTYESIKGRRWVDSSMHGRPFYIRYPLNCYQFFCHPGLGERVPLGRYARLPQQELEMAAKKDEDMLDSMEGGSRNRADDNGSYSGVNVSLDNRQIV